MSDLAYGRQQLLTGGFTCVAYNGEQLFTSQQRGVAPLLAWLDAGIDLRGYSVADKVVGKGAAYLYVWLNVKEVYAQVISQPALAILQQYQIDVVYDELVPAIRNRAGNGYCPIETAVLTADTPETALTMIRTTLAQLKSMNNN